MPHMMVTGVVKISEFMRRRCDVACDDIPMHAWINWRTDKPILIKSDNGEFYESRQNFSVFI
jgi:hypothetical protein